MATIGNAADRLGPVALAIVTLAVVVGVGSIVLTQIEPVSYQDNTVTDETAQPSSPFPTNYTVSQQSDANFELIDADDVTVTYEDSSAGTNTTLTEGTHYNVYEEEGIIEYINTTSLFNDYDSTSDVFYNDYTWESSEDATGVLSTGVDSLQTFSDFFTVIVVIAISVVLFGLLRVVRGAGRGVSV